MDGGPELAIHNTTGETYPFDSNPQSQQASGRRSTP